MKYSDKVAFFRKYADSRSFDQDSQKRLNNKKTSQPNNFSIRNVAKKTFPMITFYFYLGSEAH